MPRLSLAALAAALSAAPALAAPMTPQQEAAFRQHCSGDYMRLCSRFDPGTPQLEQCFQQRARELSPRCQATIADYSRSDSRRR